MRTARVKWVLWLTAAAGVAGAVTALVAGGVMPLDVPIAGAVTAFNAHPATAPTMSPVASLPPLESFEPAWQLPLRRPLVDPPAPVAVAAADVAAPPVPRVRLIGTIVDARHPRGIFMTGLATVELKRVGESTAGAKVIAVDENSATLTFNGTTFVLRRERAPFDPTGDAYEAAAVRPASAQKGDGG